MNKPRVKKVYVAIIITCIVVLAAALIIHPKLMPSFKFLGSCQPVSCVRYNADRLLSRQTRLTYSLEADFNDICASASSELSALGYIETTNPSDLPDMRSFSLFAPRCFVHIWIQDNQRYKVYSTPNISEYAIPDRVEPLHADGWVSVQITETRTPGRLGTLWLRLTYKLRSWFS